METLDRKNGNNENTGKNINREGYHIITILEN